MTTPQERAELVQRLNALAELCGIATGGWDLPDSATAKISSLAAKAAALIEADAGEAVANVVRDAAIAQANQVLEGGGK